MYLETIFFFYIEMQLTGSWHVAYSNVYVMILYCEIIFIFNNNTDLLTVFSSNLGIAFVEMVCLLWFVIVCKLQVICYYARK